MSRILLLGGTGEARQLAQRLASHHELTYSLAGRGRIPELPCPVRLGGFGGAAGLAAFLDEGGFELLIDATHPYAARISTNAYSAAQQAGIPLWAYRRPPWQPISGDDWRMVHDWSEVGMAIAGFRRPFFTMGLEPLQHVDTIPPGQRWLVRCLARRPSAPALIVLAAVGPFTLEQELALMRAYRIDVLVSKNSGGSAIVAKLSAARRLGIPVVMLERPPLPPADYTFSAIEPLIAQLISPAWMPCSFRSITITSRHST